MPERQIPIAGKASFSKRREEKRVKFQKVTEGSKKSIKMERA